MKLALAGASWHEYRNPVWFLHVLNLNVFIVGLERDSRVCLQIKGRFKQLSHHMRSVRFGQKVWNKLGLRSKECRSSTGVGTAVVQSKCSCSATNGAVIGFCEWMCRQPPIALHVCFLEYFDEKSCGPMHTFSVGNNNEGMRDQHKMWTHLQF